MDSRLWSESHPEPAGERQVVLSARIHFGCLKTQLAMFTWTWIFLRQIVFWPSASFFVFGKCSTAVSVSLSAQSYSGLFYCKIASYMQRDDIRWHRSSPPLKHGASMEKYLFICSVNGWNRASDNGIMVILSDASVSGRNSGNNVGYDGYRNVMTNRPAIDGKSDTITDTLSVGMMDKSDNGCSVRQSVGKKRSRIDGWIRQTFIQ